MQATVISIRFYCFTVEKVTWFLINEIMLSWWEFRIGIEYYRNTFWIHILKIIYNSVNLTGISVMILLNFVYKKTLMSTEKSAAFTEPISKNSNGLRLQ